MNTTELARKIRILEIKVDMATKAERSLPKTARAAEAAESTQMLNELAALYASQRKGA